MEVHITLEDRGTSENKHLMLWLHNNVDVFRREMKMSVSTVSSEKMASSHTTLPRVVIGARQPVTGGKNIIAEIKQAYNILMEMNAQDPVERVWRDAIRKGPDEKPDGSPKEDEMAQRFTTESSHRKKIEEQRRGRAGSRPIPPIAKSVAPHEAPTRVPPRQADLRAPTTTAGRMMQQTSMDFTTSDPDAPSTMETDPFMKKFWEANTATAGC
jgi:hypothetical protein